MGHEKIFSFLLNREDIDINQEDSKKESPLFSAIFCKQEKLVKTLLTQKKGEVDLDSKGNSVLLTYIQLLMSDALRFSIIY